MDDRELLELEDESSWDFDNAQEYPASSSGNAVVPVKFGPEAFERLSVYAERRGLHVSECIRILVDRGIAADAPDILTDSSEAGLVDPLD